MKQRKNIHELLGELEKDCKTSTDPRWIKKLKAKTRQEEKILNKLTKEQIGKKLTRDFIKLDNDLAKDFIYIEKIKQKMNERRKRRAS